MTETQIADVARQIIEQQFDWGFYLVLLLLLLIASAFTHLLAGYFSRRGTQLATKADFDEICRQLRETTHLTEEIREAMSMEGWRNRERSVVRRGQLENLLRATYELQHWLDRELNAEFFDGPPGDQPDPSYKLEIARLYLPEAAVQIGDVILAALAYKKFMLDNKRKMFQATAQQDAKLKSAVMTALVEEYGPALTTLTTATTALEERAAELMAEILNTRNEASATRG